MLKRYDLVAGSLEITYVCTLTWRARCDRPGTKRWIEMKAQGLKWEALCILRESGAPYKFSNNLGY